MAKKVSIRKSAASPPAPPVPPFGVVPTGVAMQAIPQFPPELAAALKNARDGVNGKWLIVVYTATPEGGRESAEGHVVHMHITRGPAWNDDWLLRSYRLFVMKILEVGEKILGTISKS